jgi:hypothetical protein
MKLTFIQSGNNYRKEQGDNLPDTNRVAGASLPQALTEPDVPY